MLRDVMSETTQGQDVIMSGRSNFTVEIVSISSGETWLGRCVRKFGSASAIVDDTDHAWECSPFLIQVRTEDGSVERGRR